MFRHTSEPLRLSSNDIAAKRAAFGLSLADERDLDRIRFSIREILPELVEGFYLGLTPDAQGGDAEKIMARLRREQRNYLMTLGFDSGTEAYFRSRIRVALLHRRADVGHGSYLGAHSHFFEPIARSLARRCLAGELVSALATLQRILAFDAYIIVQAYVRARQRWFQGRLDRLTESKRSAVAAARRDSVTQIDARAALLDALAIEFERSLRSGEHLSLLFLDVDGFKAVNDARGHAMGDEVLRRVVAAIKHSMRPFDVVGRYGGDEFLVGLVGASAAEARLIGERLCRSISLSAAPEFAVTVSIGCATRTVETSLAEMIRSADRAMYSAKVSGRNQVAVYAPASAGNVVDRR